MCKKKIVEFVLRMCIQDSVSDLFNRIKMGQQRKKLLVSMYSSKKLEAIVNVLKEEGYIVNYFIENLSNNKNLLNIYLKYFEGKPVIMNIKQISKQSVRVYCRWDKLPIILSGLGIGIISTSHGVMSSIKAESLKLGGEYIGFVE